MEDRLSALEKTVRNFNIVTNGVNVEGWFNELKPKPTIEERISHLEKLHEDFTIRGGANVTVEGSLKHGFAICSTCPGDDQGAGGLPGGGPPSITGACCVDGVCHISTQAQCEGTGGDYQGDGTDCDPNPCPEGTGACCQDNGGCDNDLTLSECSDIGGTWRGIGTSCFTFGICFGACCHPNGICDEKTADDCADDPGMIDFHGIGSSCDDFICGGACCYCLGCGFFNELVCDDAGGVWHEGEICDDVCPPGRCCEYDELGNFILCATTTESQCNAECCDPPCPGWTLIWTEGILGCSGGDACPP